MEGGSEPLARNFSEDDCELWAVAFEKEEIVIVDNERAQEVGGRAGGDETCVHLPTPARIVVFLAACHQVFHQAAADVAFEATDSLYNSSETAARAYRLLFLTAAFTAAAVAGVSVDSVSCMIRAKSIPFGAVFSAVGILAVLIAISPAAFSAFPADPKAVSRGLFIAGLAVAAAGSGVLLVALPPVFADHIGSGNWGAYGFAYRVYWGVLSLGSLTGHMVPLAVALAAGGSDAPAAAAAATAAPGLVLGGRAKDREGRGTDGYWAGLLVALAASLLVAAVFGFTRRRYIRHGAPPAAAAAARLRDNYSFATADHPLTPRFPASSSPPKNSSIQSAAFGTDFASDEGPAGAGGAGGAGGTLAIIGRVLLLKYPLFFAGHAAATDRLFSLARAAGAPLWWQASGTAAAVVVLAPVLERLVFRRCGDAGAVDSAGCWSSPHAKAAAAGFFAMACACGYVAVISAVFDARGDWVDDAFVPTEDLSVWLLLPGNVLLAIAEILAVASGLEFTYVNCPPSAKATGNGVFQLCQRQTQRQQQEQTQQRRQQQWVGRKATVCSVHIFDWNVPILESCSFEAKKEGLWVAPSVDEAETAMGVAVDAAALATEEARHATAETWACVEKEKDPHTAMTRLCRRAVKATSAQTRLEAASMWGVTSQQGRRELLVRVPAGHVDAILQGSGRDGCFWRPVGKEARDATPVVALNADVTRETALALLKKCGEAGGGVVLGGRRLLLRARGSGMLARVRAAAGEHAAPPLETKLRYLVSGARAREHEADVEMLLRLAGWAATVTTSFVRSGNRTCVVTGGGGPPFREIEREGPPFIVVNDYDKGEMPRPRSKRLASSLPTAPGQRRRMKLPAAEVHTDPEPAPSNKRKHEEVAQPAEAGQPLIQRAVAGVVEMLSPPHQRLKEPVEGEKAGHRHELTDE
ncbi:hypothetical protein DIPPA_16657 [Diplonema papillatum]|nr:hypothetical protein DIPPA_16657 [Diplonema papillatum]